MLHSSFHSLLPIPHQILYIHHVYPTSRNILFQYSTIFFFFPIILLLPSKPSYHRSFSYSSHHHRFRQPLSPTRNPCPILSSTFFPPSTQPISHLASLSHPPYSLLTYLPQRLTIQFLSLQTYLYHLSIHFCTSFSSFLYHTLA